MSSNSLTFSLSITVSLKKNVTMTVKVLGVVKDGSTPYVNNQVHNRTRLLNCAQVCVCLKKTLLQSFYIYLCACSITLLVCFFLWLVFTTSKRPLFFFFVGAFCQQSVLIKQINSTVRRNIWTVKQVLSSRGERNSYTATRRAFDWKQLACMLEGEGGKSSHTRSS